MEANAETEFANIEKFPGKKVEVIGRGKDRVVELQHEIGLPGHWAGLQMSLGELIWVVVEPYWIVRELEQKD